MARKLYTIERGEPLSLLIPLLLDGVATAIAGWSVWMTVKADEGQTDVQAIAQLTLGNGIAGYNATTWQADLPASATKTAAVGNYVYEIEARDPAGRPYPLESGDIILGQEINQAA